MKNKDDFIYKYISMLEKNIENNDILELRSLDRNETIKGFEKFALKEDKTIY